MRDILADLQERADQLTRQINTAQEQFEARRQQLRWERRNTVADLEAQLCAVKRLVAVMDLHRNVRSAMAAAVKVATVAAEATQAACRSSRQETEKTSVPAE